MREHGRTLRLLAILLGLSLVAAACSDDDDDEATEDSVHEEGGGEQLSLEAPTGDADPSCEGESDNVLQIGGLLPETGNLAYLGPPMEAGAQMAVDEVNEAGGVLGSPIEYTPGDSGDTSTDIATQTVDRHLNAGVDVVLGAASSGVSFTVLDTLVEECKIMFSPANTSPDFTEYDEDDLYFRTAPADVLQGRVLSEIMFEDGAETLAILHMQHPDGEDLARYAGALFEEGGGDVVLQRAYDRQAQDFDAEVEEVVSADPDALLLVGLDESSRILSSLFEQGFTPDGKGIYLTDGNMSNGTGQDFTQEGVLSGIKGTFPAAEVTLEFRLRLLNEDLGLIDFIYGPESYDAVVITALAATLAETDNPAEVARRINGVTRDGEPCTTFQECLDLINGGTTDIDYNGPSGPQEFSQPGEPTEASIAVLQFTDQNTLDMEHAEYRQAAF